MSISASPPLSPGEAPQPGRSVVRASSGSLRDGIFKAICLIAACSVIVVFVILIIVLLVQSWLSISVFGAKFLWTSEWNPNPVEGEKYPRLGALSFIYGTVVTSVIAMLIAVPLGVGTAAYLSEIASPNVRRIGAFLIELLAAIPSVVYGFWGKYFLTLGVTIPLGVAGWSIHLPGLRDVYRWFGAEAYNSDGSGILAAGIILSIMILPFITAISFDVCQAVPRPQREGALAVGATRWQMIWTVILPYARPGIIGGCFLALGRALGETMAVVMLIGNVPAIESAFTGKGATIASIIANGLNNVNSELQRSALVELALILLLVTICINALARILIWRMGARRGTSGFVGNLLRRVTNKTPTLNGTAAPALQTPQRLNANPWAQTEDKVMTGVLATCLVVTCGPLFLILGYILFAGASSINLDFFYLDAKGNPPNDPFAFYEKPDGEPRLGQGNALVGTAILVALSTLGAVPIGILAAIFLVEFRRSRLAPVVRFVGELLGGVPSIVLGILGYGLLVRPPAWLAEVSPFHGFSGWAGIFALGVMMIPIIMRSSEESMKLVPQSLRNASYALGAEYWQTITRVTVPAALPAIVTGVFLAMARIAGETAPLLLTANNSDGWVFWPGQPMPYLTYWIYNGAGDPRVPYQNLGWAAAVVLLIFVMVLNIGIRLASGKRLVTAGGTD